LGNASDESMALEVDAVSVGGVDVGELGLARWVMARSEYASAPVAAWIVFAAGGFVQGCVVRSDFEGA